MKPPKDCCPHRMQDAVTEKTEVQLRERHLQSVLNYSYGIPKKDQIRVWKDLWRDLKKIDSAVDLTKFELNYMKKYQDYDEQFTPEVYSMGEGSFMYYIPNKQGNYVLAMQKDVMEKLGSGLTRDKMTIFIGEKVETPLGTRIEKVGRDRLEEMIAPLTTMPVYDD
jgi:hypothetical protein